MQRESKGRRRKAISRFEGRHSLTRPAQRRNEVDEERRGVWTGSWLVRQAREMFEASVRLTGIVKVAGVAPWASDLRLQRSPWSGSFSGGPGRTPRRLTCYNNEECPTRCGKEPTSQDGRCFLGDLFYEQSWQEAWRAQAGWMSGSWNGERLSGRIAGERVRPPSYSSLYLQGEKALSPITLPVALYPSRIIYASCHKTARLTSLK